MPAAKAKTSQIYFLTGSDEAAVKKAASALAQKLAPGADAFGLETIDGAVDNVDASAMIPNCLPSVGAMVSRIIAVPIKPAISSPATGVSPARVRANICGRRP